MRKGRFLDPLPNLGITHNTILAPRDFPNLPSTKLWQQDPTNITEQSPIQLQNPVGSALRQRRFSAVQPNLLNPPGQPTNPSSDSYGILRPAWFRKPKPWLPHEQHYTHPSGWAHDRAHTNSVIHELQPTVDTEDTNSCTMYPPLLLHYAPKLQSKDDAFSVVPFHVRPDGSMMALKNVQDLSRHPVSLYLSFSKTTQAIIPSICHTNTPISEQTGVERAIHVLMSLAPKQAETYSIEDVQAAFDKEWERQFNI